jgi:hypothetical protein
MTFEDYQERYEAFLSGYRIDEVYRFYKHHLILTSFKRIKPNFNYGFKKRKAIRKSKESRVYR